MTQHSIYHTILKRLWDLLPFLIGLSAGLFFITLNITGYAFTHFPGDFGDGRLNLYFLEHAHKFFTGQLESFWDAPFMYPEPNVIAFSDNLLGSAPIYSFFRILGLKTFTAYQWWFVVLAILNYTTAYLLLNKLFKNKYAAVLGAMIFAFSIALQSQITHAQTFPRFAIPLAFLMAIRLKETWKPIYFFATVFFVVYQIYCGIYLGFMLAVPISVFIIIVYFNNKKAINNCFKDKRWTLHMVSALVVNLLILLPLMLPYMQRNIPPTLNNYRNVLDTVPTLKSYFFSHQGSLLWDMLSSTANDYNAWWNHQIFAGGIATLCLVLFVGMLIYYKYQNKQNMAFSNNSLWQFMLTGLITTLLFIRFGNISAYFFVYVLPGFTAMRSIARIINIELIFYAIATAFIFSRILKKESWKTIALFIIFTALLIADNYVTPGNTYRTAVNEAYERTEPLKELIGGFPEGSVISYEPSNIEGPVYRYQIDIMLASQKYDHKTINGYSGKSPVGYSSFWRNINEESRNHWLSHNNKCFDTLYVVYAADEYKKVLWQELPFTEPKVDEE